jgi:hypothetical protein
MSGFVNELELFHCGRIERNRLWKQAELAADLALSFALDL